MAVDTARAVADARVRSLVERLGSADAGSEQAALGPIGDEAAAALADAQRSLADRRIVDSKVSALRDAMVKALEFRRFQMSPQRRQMGSTPLERVNLELAMQLDRWDLPPGTAGRPVVLRSVAPALSALHRAVDVESAAGALPR